MHSYRCSGKYTFRNVYQLHSFTASFETLGFHMYVCVYVCVYMHMYTDHIHIGWSW